MFGNDKQPQANKGAQKIALHRLNDTRKAEKVLKIEKHGVKCEKRVPPYEWITNDIAMTNLWMVESLRSEADAHIK